MVKRRETIPTLASHEKKYKTANASPLPSTAKIQIASYFPGMNSDMEAEDDLIASDPEDEGDVEDEDEAEDKEEDDEIEEECEDEFDGLDDEGGGEDEGVFDASDIQLPKYQVFRRKTKAADQKPKYYDGSPLRSEPEDDEGVW